MTKQCETVCFGTRHSIIVYFFDVFKTVFIILLIILSQNDFKTCFYHRRNVSSSFSCYLVQLSNLFALSQKRDQLFVLVFHLIIAEMKNIKQTKNF